MDAFFAQGLSLSLHSDTNLTLLNCLHWYTTKMGNYLFERCFWTPYEIIYDLFVLLLRFSSVELFIPWDEFMMTLQQLRVDNKRWDKWTSAHRLKVTQNESHFSNIKARNFQKKNLVTMISFYGSKCFVEYYIWTSVTPNDELKRIYVATQIYLMSFKLKMFILNSHIFKYCPWKDRNSVKIFSFNFSHKSMYSHRVTCKSIWYCT